MQEKIIFTFKNYIQDKIDVLVYTQEQTHTFLIDNQEYLTLINHEIKNSNNNCYFVFANEQQKNILFKKEFSNVILIDSFIEEMLDYQQNKITVFYDKNKIRNQEITSILDLKRLFLNVLNLFKAKTFNDLKNLHNKEVEKQVYITINNNIIYCKKVDKKTYQTIETKFDLSKKEEILKLRVFLDDFYIKKDKLFIISVENKYEEILKQYLIYDFNYINVNQMLLWVFENNQKEIKEFLDDLKTDINESINQTEWKNIDETYSEKLFDLEIMVDKMFDMLNADSFDEIVEFQL